MGVGKSISSDTFFVGGHLWGYEDFSKRTELESSQFIKHDCLAIQCTVSVVKTSIPLPLSDLRQIYGQLLESKEESDEENTQRIRIEEMQAPVFKDLLHFIYCDVIPDVDKELDGLEAR
ncbi:hypothetical protein RD792_017175 [Penstemon davidsonii]|uniref:BTB domain-containing protein n=1 Tax=Penstemon davidsonii TaxID=160366 RepID=A0ABR0CMJ6_9LAMI|nr:hypothetical protein RD792_017175 [Penstemon davidsonii]